MKFFYLNTLRPSQQYTAWAVCLLLGLFAASFTAQAQVQLSLSSNVTYPSGASAGSMPICTDFSYELGYGVISSVSSAQNAVIEIPLNGLEFVSASNNPQIVSTTVTGTYPNDVLRVTFVNPLPAGSSGNATLRLRFPCGVTCNGTVGSLVPTFTATNASNSPLSIPATAITANSLNPTTQTELYLSSFSTDDGAGNGVATFDLRFARTNGLVNNLNLSNFSYSLTRATVLKISRN